MKKERIEEGKKEKGAKNGGLGIKCLLAGIIIPSGPVFFLNPFQFNYRSSRTFPAESCQEQEGVSLLGHTSRRTF